MIRSPFNIRKRIMNKNCIVAFAFGTGRNIPPNQELRRIASVRAKELNASVYTQQDIEPVQGIEFIYTQEVSGKVPSTLDIARNAVSWAKAQDVTDLYIVCAKPHMIRCLRDLKYAASHSGADKKISVHICPEIYDYPENFWYCKDSGQIRTQTKTAFVPRETILTLMPMWLYIRVAR